MLVEVRIGSLDEAPFELEPGDEIRVGRRESWTPPVDGAAQHDENRVDSTAHRRQSSTGCVK